jgi:hypothetical protein
MLFSDLLPQIDPKWHGAFVRFIETGDATEDFRAYLNSDKSCQNAMEQLLAAHVKTLRPFMNGVSTAPHAKRAKAAATTPKPQRTRRRVVAGRAHHTSART